MRTLHRVYTPKPPCCQHPRLLLSQSSLTKLHFPTRNLANRAKDTKGNRQTRPKRKSTKPNKTQTPDPTQSTPKTSNTLESLGALHLKKLHAEHKGRGLIGMLVIHAMCAEQTARMKFEHTGGASTRRKMKRRVGPIPELAKVQKEQSSKSEPVDVIIRTVNHRRQVYVSMCCMYCMCV